MKKPTLQQVADYCLSRGNAIDPEEWYDYQESVGWVVGRARKPMRNWQAAIRTWERNQARYRQRDLEQRAAAPRRQAGSWQESVDTLGAQLGIQPKPGESYEAYGARVRGARGRAH